MLGTGYLGATHAACMAELGHNALGVDVDAKKIEELSQGRVPFHEPGLPEVLSRNIEAGRLSFSTSYEDAAKFATVHFLGVGTPQSKDGLGADLSYVYSVIENLVPLLEGDHLILGKSTVPVGTAEKLQELADSLTKPGSSVEIAWNPEFLREGFAVKDTLTPDRIVVGVNTHREHSKAEEVSREVYAKAIANDTPFIVTNLPTAELVKVAANAFLATKISFINAVSEVCEVAGADITQLAEAIGKDDRIGPKFLRAGLGFGGGCLPKDIRAFIAHAEELGVGQALNFLREVDDVNLRRRQRVVDLARSIAGGNLEGRKVAMLGAAFKPDSDDIRDSPALEVAASMASEGAQVTVFDPYAMKNAQQKFPELSYAENTADALRGADVVVLGTEWKEFKELDPQAAAKLVNQRNMIDARNVLPLDKWRDAEWTVISLGRA